MDWLQKSFLGRDGATARTRVAAAAASAVWLPHPPRTLFFHTMSQPGRHKATVKTGKLKRDVF